MFETGEQRQRTGGRTIEGTTEAGWSQLDVARPAAACCLQIIRRWLALSPGAPVAASWPVPGLRRRADWRVAWTTIIHTVGSCSVSRHAFGHGQRPLRDLCRQHTVCKRHLRVATVACLCTRPCIQEPNLDRLHQKHRGSWVKSAFIIEKLRRRHVSSCKQNSCTPKSIRACLIKLDYCL